MGDMDCGDNSCLFSWKKGGMRTNGGCRCLPRDMDWDTRKKLDLWAQKARAKIRDLERELAEAKEKAWMYDELCK